MPCMASLGSLYPVGGDGLILEELRQAAFLVRLQKFGERRTFDLPVLRGLQAADLVLRMLLGQEEVGRCVIRMFPDQGADPCLPLRAVELQGMDEGRRAGRSVLV